jgi:hypothetical protein
MMTTTKFLDADLALMKANIHPEIQELGAEFPLALIQAAQGVGLEPLPAGYEAQLVEVYRNGNGSASQVFHGEELKYLDPDDVTASNDDVIVVEIDGYFRYVEIKGVEVLNTLGEFELPKAIADPSVQAQVVTALMSQQ